MRISIIIPTYNEQGNICKLIDYLRANSTPANIADILVVDGGSEDSTVHDAECHGGRVLLSDKKGRAVQMNAGVASSHGEILYFLHADSTPPPNFDQDIIEAVKNGSKSGCFRLRFDSENHLLRFSSWMTRLNLMVCRGGDQSLFITYQLFDKLGGFNEQMELMEEHDFISRIRKMARFKIIPRELVTSARKYRKNGYYRLQFLFSVIHMLYWCGCSQERMITFYQKHIV